LAASSFGPVMNPSSDMAMVKNTRDMDLSSWLRGGGLTD
jgi:hypothetical protein